MSSWAAGWVMWGHHIRRAIRLPIERVVIAATSALVPTRVDQGPI